MTDGYDVSATESASRRAWTRATRWMLERRRRRTALRLGQPRTEPPRASVTTPLAAPPECTLSTGRRPRTAGRDAPSTARPGRLTTCAASRTRPLTRPGSSQRRYDFKGNLLRAGRDSARLPRNRSTGRRARRRTPHCRRPRLRRIGPADRDHSRRQYARNATTMGASSRPWACRCGATGQGGSSANRVQRQGPGQHRLRKRRLDKYRYDRATYRLTELRTARDRPSPATPVLADPHRRKTSYTYDPVGNIIAHP